jgi:hypothetical protein
MKTITVIEKHIARRRLIIAKNVIKNSKYCKPMTATYSEASDIKFIVTKNNELDEC